MRRQKDRTLKEELPRSVGAQYAPEAEGRNNSRKNEETEPKRNITQLCMWLVMEDKSDAVRTILHRNLERESQESRHTGSGQTGDGESERLPSRNQRTKTGWSGQT